MKKILVTGSSGFIGTNLTSTLKDKYEVYSHDIQTLDLLDEGKVFEYLRKMGFDVVIHAATCSDSRNQKNSPVDVFNNTLNMFFNLARHHQYFGKMIYYGSGAEYDRYNIRPKVTEDSLGIYIPHGSYALSKFIMAQHTLSSVNIFELIPFAVFGPGEDWRIRFISNACCRDIFDLPIIIMKNVIFDFIYIDDLVKITEWFINNTPDQQRYNVCSLKRYDLLSLAQMIQDYSGKKKEIIVQEPGMGVEYSGDNSRLVKLINPRFTKMDDAIKAIYKWYLDNKVNIKEEELSFDSVKK